LASKVQSGGGKSGSGGAKAEFSAPNWLL